MGKIYLGSDHGGFAHKEELKKYLTQKGHIIEDVGTHSTDSVDYPDIAFLVSWPVSSNEHSLGIIIDGAGIGSCIAANKVHGIRAACCNDLYTARNSREHNHANVLTLGSMVIGTGYMKQIVDLWLSTEPAEGRHAKRVAKITQFETLTRKENL